MTTKATLKYARLSPQKMRLVADQIRGLPVDRALDILQFSNKKGAAIVKKVLESAIANAEHNDGADCSSSRSCRRPGNRCELDGACLRSTGIAPLRVREILCSVVCEGRTRSATGAKGRACGLQRSQKALTKVRLLCGRRIPLRGREPPRLRAAGTEP